MKGDSETFSILKINEITKDTRPDNCGKKCAILGIFETKDRKRKLNAKIPKAKKKSFLTFTAGVDIFL